MTLTFAPNLDRVKMNHHARCVVKIYFETHRHTSDRLLYLLSKVLGNETYCASQCRQEGRAVAENHRAMQYTSTESLLLGQRSEYKEY